LLFSAGFKAPRQDLGALLFSAGFKAPR